MGYSHIGKRRSGVRYTISICICLLLVACGILLWTYWGPRKSVGAFIEIPNEFFDNNLPRSIQSYTRISQLPKLGDFSNICDSGFREHFGMALSQVRKFNDESRESPVCRYVAKEETTYHDCPMMVIDYFDECDNRVVSKGVSIIIKRDEMHSLDPVKELVCDSAYVMLKYARNGSQIVAASPNIVDCESESYDMRSGFTHAVESVIKKDSGEVSIQWKLPFCFMAWKYSANGENDVYALSLIFSDQIINQDLVY